MKATMATTATAVTSRTDWMSSISWTSECFRFIGSYGSIVLSEGHPLRAVSFLGLPILGPLFPVPLNRVTHEQSRNLVTPQRPMKGEPRARAR